MRDCVPVPASRAKEQRCDRCARAYAPLLLSFFVETSSFNATRSAEMSSRIAAAAVLLVEVTSYAPPARAYARQLLSKHVARARARSTPAHTHAHGSARTLRIALRSFLMTPLALSAALMMLLNPFVPGVLSFSGTSSRMACTSREGSLEMGRA